jgi:hypothetical protein
MACHKADAEITIGACPREGARIPVRKETLRENGMDIPAVVMRQRNLGAFLETIEALAVDGAELEDVVHEDLLRGYSRFRFNRPVLSIY